MGRGPSCVKGGVKVHKGAWTALEDKKLVDYVTAHGDRKWSTVAREAGLKRCAKSCRLRWLNYLRPDIKRGNITEDEEDLIIRLHRLLGNRWSLIAGRLPGRTDNEIKNYWNTHMIKKEKARRSGNVTVEDPTHDIFNRAESVKPLGLLQQDNTRLDPLSAEVSSSEDPDFELVESRSGKNVSPNMSPVEAGLWEFKMGYDDLDDDLDLSGIELDFDFSRLAGDGLLGQSSPWLPHGLLGTWSSEFASGEDWIM